jgi:apolipoprotein N-acyltransferase
VSGSLSPAAWRPAALALLSGALLFLSFPKFGHGSVAWIALTPLLLAIARRPEHGARLAYLSGVISSIGLLYWTALVVVEYGGLSQPVAFVAMILLCLAFALFHALFGWLLGRAVRAFGAEALLAAPVVWVATEILRRHTFFSFPWCLLGYSQHDALSVVQVASVAGVYGVSAVVMLASSALAYVVVAERRPRRLLAGTATLLILAGVWGFGMWRLGHPPAEVGRVRVGLVQAAIAQSEKWDPTQASRNIHLHYALTRRAAREGARFVVWPESAVTFYYDWTPALAAELQALARDTGVSLLFGNDDRSDDPEGERIFVGAKLLDPSGALVYRYHKMQLVPFGEYVPLESLLGRLGVQRLVQAVGSFTPGATAVVGQAEGVRFGVTICYEAIFPDLVRRFCAGGAELLANITNDAWYGWTSAPYQHFASARLRAVENGRYLVRAANTGISAVIDPRGRILARTRLFERTALVCDVGAVRETTFYSRWGDVFAWTCLGLTALMCGATFVRRWVAR